MLWNSEMADSGKLTFRRKPAHRTLKSAIHAPNGTDCAETPLSHSLGKRVAALIVSKFVRAF